MAEDKHANMKFNSGSPSSDRCVVEKIVREFMKSSDALALDIGGTKLGFIGHLSNDELRSHIILVNTDGDEEIAFRKVSLVPDDERYDLVMMFGTAMYMGQAELRHTFDKTLKVLKPGGTFLISDINGHNPAGWIELGLKYLARAVQIIARVFGKRWRPMPLHLHSKSYVAKELRSIGFSMVKSRPDLKARSGWHPLFRWMLYFIQPTRYYVLAAEKAPALSSS